MSISLPNNKEEKRQRLIMLVKQGSISVIQFFKLYTDYCRLYDKTNEQFAVNYLIRERDAFRQS